MSTAFQVYYYVRYMMPTLRNILVVRTDRLGDVILTLPLCDILRRAIPDVRIAMLSQRYALPLLTRNPLVDEAIAYDTVGGEPVPFGTMVEELKKRAFDAAIVARPTVRIAALLAAAGIPLRVGTGYRWYSFLFTHRMQEHRRTAERHELEYNARLATMLGIAVPEKMSAPQFGITVPATIEKNVGHILASVGVSREKDVVVLHPGSGGSARDWPPERFKELADRLLQHEHVAVVLTGTHRDERVVRKVLEGGSQGELVSLVGSLDLAHLAALLRRAALYVSNSTGPLHLAVAMGTPVIGLFPPVRVMSAHRWGPYAPDATVLTGNGPENCSICRDGAPCACMMSISVERVAEEAHRVLAARHQRLKVSLS